MRNVLKKVAAGLAILFFSTAIYFMLSSNKQQQKDVLRQALGLLGDQLLSLFPNQETKRTVASKWSDFSEKAEKGEVPPEKLERVAVGILNASNSSDVLSVADAQVILDLALKNADGLKVYLQNPVADAPVTPRAPRPPAPPEVKKRLDTRAYRVLGEQIKSACELNKKLQKTISADVSPKVVWLKHLQYECEDGIKLKVDPGVKRELKAAVVKRLEAAGNSAGGSGIVVWQTDLASELSRAHARIRAKLDSLEALVLSERERLGADGQMAAGVQRLRLLEKLQAWQAVDPDSLARVVTLILETEEATKRN